MSRDAIIGVAAVLVLVALIVGFARLTEAPTGEQTKVRKVVLEFGESLKMVSLLAPQEDVRTAMESYYKAYVAPELLLDWEANPADAPGRITSSPWPDHIEIASLEKKSDGTYLAEGALVEKTSTEGPGEAATQYSVRVVLENRAGAWLITDYQASGYTGGE